MPSLGFTRHTEATAKKMQVLALQAKNALDGLLIVDRLRAEGVIDFNTIDFNTSMELGAFGAGHFEKALDCAKEMHDQGVLDRLTKIIKVY